ncbi:MAG: metallophosphoesterase family protein [Promethearchaeota archaeon]|jgi:putative phosphoesterase
MVKLGIISDTHLSIDDDANISKNLLREIKDIFLDVDEIIHAGDICEPFVVDLLQEIAPIKSVRGETDKIEDLKDFIVISANKYNIGVIHKKPENLEVFFKKNDIHILIFGHTHQPLIEGTTYNTLLINPGSPTQPKAPLPKRGFDKPIARPTVITLKIDEDNLLSTYVINLKNL